jgi:hypothetical protein
MPIGLDAEACRPCTGRFGLAFASQQAKDPPPCGPQRTGHLARPTVNVAVVPSLRTLVIMSEPARDIPVSPAVEQAVELARRGVIIHLTVGGERVAAIVPESVLEALRDAEDAAEAETAMREPGDSIPLEELEAEFGL